MESLLRHIGTPGLKVEDMFKRVRNEVRVKTNGKQVPWEYSSIEGDFYFARMGTTPPAISPPMEPIPPPRREPVAPHPNLELIELGESKTGSIGEGQVIEYKFNGVANVALRIAFQKDLGYRYLAQILGVREQPLKSLAVYTMRGADMSFTPPTDGQYVIRLTGKKGQGKYVISLSE